MLYRIYIALIALILVSTGNMFGAIQFKQTGKWLPKGDPIYGQAGPMMIDKNNNIVGVFYKTGARLISPKQVIVLARYGQGPSDLQNFCGICDYKGDLAIYELPGKIKIFTLKDGNYTWRKNIWLKIDRNFFVEQNILFHDNKWFVAGLHYLDYNQSPSLPAAFVTIYDERGKPLKTLIESRISTETQYFQMEYFIIANKDKIFLLVENQTNVYIISAVKMYLEKNVKLEIPSFYKPMPDSFYRFKNNQGPSSPTSLEIELENWKTGYSSISNAIIDNGYLLVQIRTADKRYKKFALLFYTLDSLKLKYTLYTDDYLMAAKNGKYYFYANGNPGIDDGTDSTIINIYEWINK